MQEGKARAKSPSRAHPASATVLAFKALTSRAGAQSEVGVFVSPPPPLHSILWRGASALRPTPPRGETMNELVQHNPGSSPKAKSERVVSTISFPYSDMSDALSVAEGMMKGGGVGMTRDQLAAAMGLAPGGGSFATKIATARMFGVIDATSGKYELTDLGHEILEPARQGDARIRAFLNVPLYKRAYDEFKGRLLPPRPYGLEAAFIKFGVSQKTVKAARLAFEKSARMAGFFPNATEDRLVMPFGVSNENTGPDNGDGGQRGKVIEAGVKEGIVMSDALPVAGQAVTGIHKSILGMLDELPPPKTKWSKEEQADWLQALGHMFQVIYKSDDKGEIEVIFKPSE